jgi:hypothetical protein
MPEQNGKMRCGAYSMDVVIANARNSNLYKLIHKKSDKSKCLDISGYYWTDSYKEDDKVCWWEKHGCGNQEWELEPRTIPNNNGEYYIRTSTSNKNLYLCNKENDNKYLSSGMQNRVIFKYD